MAVERLNVRAQRTQALTNITVDNSANEQRNTILGELGKFANKVSGVADRQVAAKIETEKALGSSKAARDMLVAAERREGITPEDSKAQSIAYNEIMGQHETMQASNSFIEWYKQNPSASDEEIESMKSELYQPLFEKWGGDETSLNQISLQVQDSQYKLVGVESSIKNDYLSKKRFEAMEVSVNDLMSTPEPDLDFLLDKELPARAKSLGIDEFNMKKSIMENMLTRAKEGDSRLLDKLETVGWAKDSNVVKRARTAYSQFVAKQEAVERGDLQGSIELENRQLDVPWSTTLRKIDNFNKQYPESAYTQRQIASMKQMRKRREKEESTKTEALQAIATGNIPFALDNKFSPKEKKEAIKSQEEAWAAKTTELIEIENLPEDKVNELIVGEKLKFSRKERMVVPSLKSSIDATINLSVDELAVGEGLPAYATSGLSLLKRMDVTAVGLYTSGEQRTFAQNFKRFAESYSDEVAFRKADKIRRSPFKVDPATRTKQRDELVGQINDRLENDIFEYFSEKDVALDVPQLQRDQLAIAWQHEAFDQLSLGNNDVEANAELVIKTNLARMSQAPNGTLLNIDQYTLADKISEGRPMAANKAPEYVDGYLKSIEANYKAITGYDYVPDQVTLEFSRDGSTFVVRDLVHGIIPITNPTNSLYDVGRKAIADKLEGLNEAEEAAKKRERTQGAVERLTSRQSLGNF